MKSWLKGGLILDIIYFVLVFLGLILGPLHPGIFIVFILAISIPGMWVTIFAPTSFYSDGFGWIFAIGSLITYFLIGALIGWLVGKIKSRKQTQINS
ncbi:MAG: hypothetical protein KKF67_02775 [Nanoarchaeota archaeon]|nr:hypothetical protein [Nanoarchaeota archaeon]